MNSGFARVPDPQSTWFGQMLLDQQGSSLIEFALLAFLALTVGTLLLLAFMS